MSEGPVHDHDCTRCRYLGTTGPTWGYPKANAVDHYACEGAIGGVTLIQRGGSEGPNYLSIPVDLCRDAVTDPWATTFSLFARPDNNLLANLRA